MPTVRRCGKFHAEQALLNAGFGLLAKLLEKFSNAFFIITDLLVKQKLIGFENGKVKCSF